METSESIRGRRSVRVFLPDVPPPELVKSILDDARWAPSWGNSQAWHVYVLTGSALDMVKKAYVQFSREGAESPTDLEMPTRAQWSERVLGRMNLTPPGETWTPPPGPTIWEMYGAPYLLLFAIDPNLVPHYACFDAGLLAENVCLAAHDKGLGTVIMAVAVRYPDVLRKAIPEASGKHFVVGVALGYPDPAAAQNTAPRARADLDELVSWVAE